MNVRFLPAAGALASAVLVAAVLPAAGGGLQPQGAEVQLTRGLPGDQVNPAVLLGARGGLLVWQDAAIDGQGLGLAGVRIDVESGATVGSVFRVNESAADDQENPSLTKLADGSAFVVWQGGKQGFQRIFGRILSSQGAPLTGDLEISSGAGELQSDPAVATLADGSVVVVWASLRQDGSFSYDIYARRFSAGGEPLGDEFRVNATSGMHRRTPTLAALADGGVLVGWISERQLGVRDHLSTQGQKVSGSGLPVYEVVLTVRRLGSDGSLIGAERKVSDVNAVAANPVLAPLDDGRVVAAWTRKDPESRANHLDVASRVITASGDPVGTEQLVNTTLFGDQYRPRLAVTAHGVFAIWTSMGQDGSYEGVFGRWLDENGQPIGDEIPINGQTGGGQLLPAVATAPDSSLMVTWSSNLPRTGYELFAQRYAPLMLRVESVGDHQLRLRWPTVAGGVYQLQSSSNGSVWSNIGGARSASGGEDAVELSVSGQMVLYRVLRAR